MYNAFKSQRVPLIHATIFHISVVFHVGRDGVNTLLLEKKKFPRDKYCGDAVCKTGIEILQDMGIYTELIKQNKAKVVSISYYV